MRRTALAGLLSLAAGALAPAYAADIRLPVRKAAPPAFIQTYYNWTGFYIGGHVGYGWADFTGTDTFTGAITDSAAASGMIYGGTVGFNYQLGSWVFGVEGDFTFGDVKWTEDFLGLATAEVKVDQIYTAAGRIGYAFDRWMVFGKFGGAWTQEQYNFSVFGATATGTVNRTGYLLGVGLEYAFLGNWTAKVEYNYMDLGSKDVTLAVTGGLVVTPATVDLTVQTVKFGVNYKFGWGY